MSCKESLYSVVPSLKVLSIKEQWSVDVLRQRRSEDETDLIISNSSRLVTGQHYHRGKITKASETQTSSSKNDQASKDQGPGAQVPASSPDDYFTSVPVKNSR